MNVAIVGAGSWGTAVAHLIAPRAERVSMWSHDPQVAVGISTRHLNPRYLSACELPRNVRATRDYAEALADADAVIFAVPSAFLRPCARAASAHIGPATPVLCLSKGIEAGTGRLMTEVLADELGGEERIAALSGPNHAEEVWQGGLSAAVCAAAEARVGERFKELFISPAFRVYLSDDLIGVEICAAVKNVIAIVCGIAAGFGYGDNTLAMIMTRGLAETSRLVYARGGNPLTCMGLAGMGDLVATCTSEHSRNRCFGVACARGATLAAYERSTHMVVEGGAAALSVAQLARAVRVDAPITFALESTLHRDVAIRDALGVLIDRFPTEEFYGMGEERRASCAETSA